MLETYDYDDSDFQNKLDTLGFFVGKCSQTNYWTTEFAMSAILNMEYVDTFFDESKIHSDWSQSTVIKTFVELGYTTISFETRAINNNRQNLGSDINFSRSESENSYRIIKNLNLYELRLAEISWSRYWLMGLAIRPDNEAPTFDDVMDYDKFIQYQETHYYLETLEEIPHMDVSPKFVYAQFFVPHAPFIFNPEGGFVPRQFSDFLVGYKHNAIFIDAQIIDIAEKIIELSENPPIIIIQGDHGRHGDGPKEHTVILNAYYLPDGGNQQLYDSISPINSFRMIFDTYFSTDYGLLEDKSYYAYYTQRTITGSEIVPNYCDIE